MIDEEGGVNTGESTVGDSGFEETAKEFGVFDIINWRSVYDRFPMIADES